MNEVVTVVSHPSQGLLDLQVDEELPLLQTRSIQQSRLDEEPEEWRQLGGGAGLIDEHLFEAGTHSHPRRICQH